jgi:hypothetical protein
MMILMNLRVENEDLIPLLVEEVEVVEEVKEEMEEMVDVEVDVVEDVVVVVVVDAEEDVDLEEVKKVVNPLNDKIWIRNMVMVVKIIKELNLMIPSKCFTLVFPSFFLTFLGSFSLVSLCHTDRLMI